jgi:AAA domain, putative AbiEii toxin, Type IV TA system
MLEYLEIENAGPADHLRLDLAPRLNLLTGDNGLGKSFLLDIAWWAFAQEWPSESNPKLQTGLPIFPTLGKSAQIRFKIFKYEEVRKFERHIFKWEKQNFKYGDIIIYAQADGSFSIFDRLRNYGGSNDHGPNPYIFSNPEIWNGLKRDNIDICNGLIRDLSSWKKENSSAFKNIEKVLNAISPDSSEIFSLGDLVRISPDNSQDIPTIKTHSGNIAVVYTSSGVRRILAFAYLLVWAWEEHLRACELREGTPAKEILFLIDELDVHLHPKWQRTIVKSLMEVMKVLAPEVKVQIIAATHSPLVMASVEPFFDPAQDAWFDLDLNRETGQVEVTKRSEHWYRRGDADAWLKSEAFDQKSGYAPETEQALDEAKAAMGNPATTREQADAIDAKLRRLLGEMNTFWVRWGYFFEEQGWRK